MEERDNINQGGRKMKEILRELCKIKGMIDGEIKCQSMDDEDEEFEVMKLIRSSNRLEEAINDIESFKDNN
jgi:hypothetical protein